MEFGVFDHLDRYDGALADYYEDRLKIAEAYDRAGFYAYHLAEHHSTPLGMAPSPSVFLAALAQRTRKLRFGPLVWAMPLHHPLRLIEEICMLDQLSGGRLEIGFGRGAAPIELEYYGVDPQDAQEIYAEAVELVIKGLTQKVLDFKGRRFSFSGVPMELEPLQKPHPPIWYGVHARPTAPSARRAAPLTSSVSIRRTRPGLRWSAIAPSGGKFMPARPCPSSASAVSSSLRRTMPRRWPWHVAPTSSGTRALLACFAATDGSNHTPARRLSTYWWSAVRASPARRRRSLNFSPRNSKRPAAITSSGNSRSAT